ncbi:MAG: methionine gamma-lyase family protein [Oscillospiraceae bacterium]|nr:methionine gamma-lyase family protein [Oscillospiraceae bacterium]
MDFFKIDDRLEEIGRTVEASLSHKFSEIDSIAFYNESKVLRAFIDNKISDTHFAGSTGYGYGDKGRDALDSLYAQIFGAEDALVRHNFVSGTHALSIALFGILRPGDRLLSLTGKPYDTMKQVIGIDDDNKNSGSLKDYGINYQQLDLIDDKIVDFDGIKHVIKGAKVAYIQRSRGYSIRQSLTIDEIEKITKIVHKLSPKTIVVIDNCYGEFVCKNEPTDVGADLIVGSLIKNPGGGIAQTGGYIAGRKDLVELCSYRLTAPGIGKEVGCSLEQNKNMYMGIFFAPSVTANALKVSAYSRALFQKFGFVALPKDNEKISDIVSVLQLGSKEALIAFCQGIQSGSPIDSFVTPEPWDMPGYDSQVIMAAGAFTNGSSIEISADAPLKPPYNVYLQGGLTYNSGKISVLLAAQSLIDRGLLSFNGL